MATRTDRNHDPAVELTHDPVNAVANLKREGGLDMWLCGGGELAGLLMPQIDRLVLKRNPVAFGDGIPLFGRSQRSPIRFELTGTRRFESGVVIEEYRQQ